MCMNLLNFLFPSTIKWPKISGEKSYLECFDLKYIHNLKDFLKNMEVFRFSFGAPFNFNQNEVVEKYLTQVAQNKGKTLSIFTKEGNVFIGVVHIFFINYFLKSYKFGIMIGDRNNLNKGIGEDCVKAAVKHLFEKENANSIVLETADFNIRAQKCFEKCSFKKIKNFNEFDTFTKQNATKVFYKITKKDYQNKNQNGGLASH